MCSANRPPILGRYDTTRMSFPHVVQLALSLFHMSGTLSPIPSQGSLSLGLAFAISGTVQDVENAPDGHF